MHPIDAGRSMVDRSFDLRGAGKWLLLGTVLGVVAGCGAILFQMGLEALRVFSFHSLMGIQPGHPGGEPPDFHFPLAPSPVAWLLLVLPAAGGLVAGLLVHYLAPEARGHGTDAAILAFHRRGGYIRKRVPVVKFFATIITMGTGGSGGREGPIAQIGAGLGSFLATRLGLGARHRRWLLAAGLGAGVGAIFRAPLAGAMFAAEVLYSDPEFETEVILPAAVTSIVAYSVFTAKYGFDRMFTSAGVFGFSSPLELGPYLVLALVVAAAALLYIKVFHGTEALFKRLNLWPPLKPMIGGFLTGLVGFVLFTQAGDARVIDVMSTGYGILQDVLSEPVPQVGIGILLLVSFGKILTTSLTIGSGGSAGVFGPSMVIGGTLGGAVGQLFHGWMPQIVQHPGAFAVVGMAGFFSAAGKVPLSTVIMVSEMTGDYALLVPAVWVCALAYLVSRRWTIFGSQVPSKVFSPAHYGDFAMEIMGHTRIDEIYKKDRKWVPIPAATPLREVPRLTAETRQRVFPVIGEGNRLIGCFHQGELVNALHDESPDPPRHTAQDLVARVRQTVTPEDTVRTAQRMMAGRGVDELVVVDAADLRRVVGVVTSADVLLAYNRRMATIERHGVSESERVEPSRN